MSKVTIIQCDRCKENITNVKTIVKANITTDIVHIGNIQTKICDGDYCYSCFLKIIEENFKELKIKYEEEVEDES